MSRNKFCKCGKITRNAIRCDACEAKLPTWMRKRSTSTHVGSSTQRGYDSKWKKLRLSYLDDHPLCEVCDENGYVTPAVEVHHKEAIVDAPHRRLSWNNLQALCVPCHRAADARRRGEAPWLSTAGVGASEPLKASKQTG